MKVRFQLSITSQNPFTSSPKSVDLDGHTNILPGNIKYTKFLTFWSTNNKQYALYEHGTEKKCYITYVWNARSFQEIATRTYRS